MPPPMTILPVRNRDKRYPLTSRYRLGGRQPAHLAGATVVKITAEQPMDPCNPRAKLVGKGFGIVAVPRQLRLKVVDAGGQHVINDGEVNRLYASGKPRLERPQEIAPETLMISRRDYQHFVSLRLAATSILLRLGPNVLPVCHTSVIDSLLG